MISLVTATLGRVNEVEDLLISLSKQTYKKFELIIVDQNDHKLLADLVKNYQNLFTIKYIRSNRKGLSINRNVGIQYCEGNIIGFPDDDCYYSDNVLKKVSDAFSKNKSKFVLLEAIDPKLNIKYITKEKDVLFRKDIMKKCISFNVFTYLNKDVKFDDKLGVGAYFGSGEETDYMWSVIKNEDKGEFLQNAYVYHPANLSSNDLNRAYKYALGFGAIFKKEYLRQNNFLVVLQFINYLIRSLGGIIFSKNKKFYYETLKGRLKGFKEFNK